MKVEVSYDGKINAFDKQNGHIYEDIFYFEDAADAGDVYVFKKAENDTVFTSRALKPEMKYTLKTDFETRIAITYQLLLPACYDDDRRARSQETETNKVVVTLGLKKGNKVMHINFNIDNRSCDHRLRAIFKTGIAENFTYSSIPFDIIKRDNRKVLEGSSNGDQPNSGLICLENKDRGVAVVNEGIFEYEHLLGDEGLLAITLVRANEYISKTMVGGSVYKIDEFWHVPGNQCIRNIELDAGISFYTGDFITNNIKSLSDSFQNPMLVCYQPVDMKIFDGGRPVVQASGVAETFFRDDPFKNIILPYNRKLIELKGSNIQLSALKKAEKGNSLVVRVYNSAPEEREFALKYYKPYHSVKRINLNEEFIENIQIEMDCTKPVKIKSGEIQTLLID
jgi:alpha-mannosidase